MLAPDQRTLMLDALRPPSGYTFDRGIGTSFTLNLMTLLVAPLSLALHDVSSSEEALADPVLLLDGVRHYADRLTLFCQAGYIAIPKDANHLYRYLEDMVVEVKAPNGGLFHPKIWLLRYTCEGANPIYRFLCLSRNVDFSRSWDTILRLDGELTDRKVGYSRNKPLGDFIEALPGFALHRTKKQAREAIHLLQEEVRRVDFKVPWPFSSDSLEFMPLGDRKHRRVRLDFPKLRSMVVSPFLSDDVLIEASTKGKGHVLFSEAESLKRIPPETLSRFSDIYIFNDVSINMPLNDEAIQVDNIETSGDMVGDPARLHAKLFIFEEGWDAQWWIGSTNATWPALSGSNVEFMVGLKGRKSQVGIDKLLGEENDKLSLRAMLADYEPDDQAKTNPEAEAAERLLEEIRTYLIALNLRLSITSGEGDNYDMLLDSGEKKGVLPEGDITIRAWPVTIREQRGQTFSAEIKRPRLTFSDLSVLQLTSFVAFEIEGKVGRTKRAIRFVMNLPVRGFPHHRDDYVISAILSDKKRFLQYLHYLLVEELGWLPGIDDKSSGAWGEGGRWAEGVDDQIPLLEDIIRAFSRSPDKIDQVTEIVERLCATPEGQKVLPEGFEALWDTIRVARESET